MDLSGVLTFLGNKNLEHVVSRKQLLCLKFCKHISLSFQLLIDLYLLRPGVVPA